MKSCSKGYTGNARAILSLNAIDLGYFNGMIADTCLSPPHPTPPFQDVFKAVQDEYVSEGIKWEHIDTGTVCVTLNPLRGTLYTRLPLPSSLFSPSLISTPLSLLPPRTTRRCLS